MKKHNLPLKKSVQTPVIFRCIVWAKVSSYKINSLGILWAFKRINFSHVVKILNTHLTRQQQFHSSIFNKKS